MKIAKSKSFTKLSKFSKAYHYPKLAEEDVNYYDGIYVVKLNLPFQWAIKKGW